MKLFSIYLVYFFAMFNCHSQNTQGLTVDNILELIDILQNNNLLFCEQIETHKLEFFPTRKISKKFRKKGATNEMLACLKETFTNKLKFHVITFDCLSGDCGGISKDLIIETIEAIFAVKNGERHLINLAESKLLVTLRTGRNLIISNCLPYILVELSITKTVDI